MTGQGLDARFREVLGRSPIRYLNERRMLVAQDLLATTDFTVAAFARRVEYDGGRVAKAARVDREFAAKRIS